MSSLEINLGGKVSIVTGCNQGLGKGIAMMLAKVGSSVVLADQETHNLESMATEIRAMQGKSLVQKVDITQEEEVKSMVQNTLDAFDRIDILVNNAGTVCRVPAEETTLEQWNHVIGVNLTGTFLCGREVGKVMIQQKRGKIVNIASINSAVARPNLSAYGSSKAGVMQLTKCWAIEWAQHNINVNAVGPSFVETEMMAEFLKKEDVRNYLLERLPLKRFGTVTDVATAVIFLVSDASDYITGHTLFVDGGWIAQ